MVPAGWWAPLEKGTEEWVLGARHSKGGGGVGGWAGWGPLTVDLHAEGHTGAARGVVGCAAVVAAVGRAQGLQLEEPAVLWELCVGVRLYSAPPEWGDPHQRWAGPAQPPETR